MQGTNVVASMVVFEDGLARKSEYRRFIVRGATQAGVSDEPVTVDDTAAMREVLTRRFRRYLEDAEGAGDLDLSTGVVGGVVRPTAQTSANGSRRLRRHPPMTTTSRTASGPIDPETGRPRRFAYPPSLVVVDGGLPQVNAGAGGARRARHRGGRPRRARQAPRGGVAARARTTR